MPLPKSLTQPLREGQLNVGAGYRAYFAPFNLPYAVANSSRVLGPTIYDLQVVGKFLDGSPPAGWSDLGLIDKFKFTPGDKVGNVTTGYRGAVSAKYRCETAEKVTFVFREISHMAMKIARGSQVFNALKTTASASTTGPLSATGTAAIPMGASGYCPTGITATATAGLPTLFVPSGSGAAFPAGTYIVCDQDYSPSTYGYVGDSGAFVFQGAVTNVDYTRMTSDYVNCVSSVVTGVSGQDALILTQAFVGGGCNPNSATVNTAPTTGAKVQAITGFVARSGGSFIKEWSMVACLDTIDASQFLWYYPRLGPDTFAGLDEVNLENANSLKQYQLNASFDAMAFDDPLDGETVTSYNLYTPHTGPMGLAI